jgi:hypothetical protein
MAATYLSAQAGTGALTDVFIVLTILSLATIAAALFLPGRKATAALADADRQSLAA